MIISSLVYILPSFLVPKWGRNRVFASCLTHSLNICINQSQLLEHWKQSIRNYLCFKVENFYFINSNQLYNIYTPTSVISRTEESTIFAVISKTCSSLFHPIAYNSLERDWIPFPFKGLCIAYDDFFLLFFNRLDERRRCHSQFAMAKRRLRQRRQRPQRCLCQTSAESWAVQYTTFFFSNIIIKSLLQ